MGKKTFDILRVCFIIYIALVVVSFLVVLLLCFNRTDFKPKQGFKNFEENWVDTTGEVVDLDELMYSTKLTKQLPQISMDCVLFFRCKNLNVAVYKDGELYRDYGEILMQESCGYKTPGTYFLSVPITRDDSYKTITLDISCPYEDSSSNIKGMYLGDSEDIYSQEIRNKIVGFCTCLLLVFLGIIFIAVSVPLNKYDTSVSSLANLGLFAVVVGVWAATETKLLQLLLGHTAIIHMVTGLTLLLIIPPLFMFFKNRYEGASKRVVTVVCVLTPISYFISIALHMSGYRDLHESIRIAHCMLGLGCVLTLFIALQGSRKRGFKDAAVIGLAGIAICSLIDIILYYFQVTTDSSTFVRFGVLFYVTFLGIQILGNYAKVYQQNKQNELIYRLAYEDLLTNLLNRNSFTDATKELNLNLSQHVGKIVAIFDVNCLKYINDTFGHSMGDSVIREGADLVRNTFGDIAKCYRIGGDEFAIICDTCDITEQEMERRHMQFSMFTQSRNANPPENKPYPLYVAFGYATITEEAESIKDILNLADQRMYADKKLLKERIKQETQIAVRE